MENQLTQNCRGWKYASGLDSIPDDEIHSQELISMNIMSWNIRGIGSPQRNKMLKNKIKHKKTMVLFLQETKCSVEAMDSIISRIWRRSEVASIGAVVCQVEILWDPKSIRLDNCMDSHRHITKKENFLGSSLRSIVTNVYRS